MWELTPLSPEDGSSQVDLHPDPDAVTSVSELGYQLRLLRLSAGAPTLRLMATSAAQRGVSLPRSTIGNAVSGRHLPSLDTVLTFASVCGCPTDELSRWRAAWQRAYARRYMRHVDPSPVATPPAMPEGDDRAVDALLAAQISALPLAQSVQRLTAMDPHQAALILTGLGARPASTRLALMQEERTRMILVMMPPPVAAECMEHMDDDRVLLLLSDMAEDAAAARIAGLAQPTVARLLTRMGVQKAATIVQFMRGGAVRLPDQLSDDFTLRLLQAMEVEIAARVPVGGDRLQRLLNSADARWAVDVLDAMAPGRTFVHFERMPEKRRNELFCMIKPEHLGEIIVLIEPEEPRYWYWLAGIGEERVTEALDAMDPTHAARALEVARYRWPTLPGPPGHESRTSTA
ncbi:helix-turn-helix transcriptional regulator [Streptomyces sp. NBC_01750]|uniref:helix-turn-helix transcriptional regulator n=1 Tax=Streptomyces sp. NBC_01750 TaxID=2975928 RepID=UPI002DDC15F9|nr:helix-turn-helix transcriptional regulator [Streptomyces sp. NBC_01750]WSD30709.1 helix-turn-helix domain-containing protein [Streptomyces sp. NBC_01750]